MRALPAVHDSASAVEIRAATAVNLLFGSVAMNNFEIHYSS
jgi:hypothetical protein